MAIKKGDFFGMSMLKVLNLWINVILRSLETT